MQSALGLGRPLSRAALVALAVGMLASCRGKHETPGVPAAASSAFTEPDKVALMERHYNAAIAAHDALISGDVSAMSRHLAELGAQTLPKEAPASWAEPHEQMRQAARRATDVSKDVTGASSMASVVEACGSCHAGQAQGPVYQKPGAPEGGGVEAAMQTHQWASERLWEGVTGPWDDAWKRGARALARADVFAKDGGAISAELSLKEAQLRKLGAEAERTEALSERAALYGKILAGCAECHRQVGIVIQPAKVGWRR